MLLPARPTLRCLQSDLLPDLEDPVQARLVSEDPERCRPLHAIEHLALRKAQDMFPVGEDVAAQRESISAARGHPWWKLKTSAWRGAVHQDMKSGQAWLCATARRREGDRDDFYEEFGQNVSANGHSAYLPTPEDLRLLKLDRADGVLALWQDAVQRISRDVLDSAVAAGGQAVGQLPMPATGQSDLATCSVEVYELEGFVEVTVVIEGFDWKHLPLIHAAERVVLTGIDPQEQHWRPGSADDGQRRIYSLVLDATHLADFVRLAHLERRPGQSEAGCHKHWTDDSELTRKSIEGKAVEGLCGTWFVPRQDHDKCEMCPSCDARYRALEPAHS